MTNEQIQFIVAQLNKLPDTHFTFYKHETYAVPMMAVPMMTVQQRPFLVTGKTEGSESWDCTFVPKSYVITVDFLVGPLDYKSFITQQKHSIEKDFVLKRIAFYERQIMNMLELYHAS